MHPGWNRVLDAGSIKRGWLILGGLTCLNGVLWAWAWIALRGHAALLSTALAAYLLGLRHAVDADHIAAIDNATRRLLHEGERPAAAGLFFALGHSSLVILAAVIVAATSVRMGSKGSGLDGISGHLGLLASVGFLWLIAAVNLWGLRRQWRASSEQWRADGQMRQWEQSRVSGGLARLCEGLFRLVRRSWHLIPIGMLFGLGFETASEVILLGISADQAARGTGWAAVLLFPLLFSAGMMLIDTLDGVFMMRAYAWALNEPSRRFRYNTVVTLLSVGVAIVVGTLELAGAWGTEEHGGKFVALAQRGLADLGVVTIAAFALCWGVGAAVHRRRRSSSALQLR